MAPHTCGRGRSWAAGLSWAWPGPRPRPVRLLHCAGEQGLRGVPGRSSRTLRRCPHPHPIGSLGPTHSHGPASPPGRMAGSGGAALGFAGRVVWGPVAGRRSLTAGNELPHVSVTSQLCVRCPSWTGPSADGSPLRVTSAVSSLFPWEAPYSAGTALSPGGWGTPGVTSGGLSSHLAGVLVTCLTRTSRCRDLTQ